VQLAIGYRCQFEPDHLGCVRHARDEVFGKLRVIEADFGYPIGNPAQWRLDRALSAGGPLMDVGTYGLQTARLLAGREPLAVSAVQTNTDSAKFRGIEQTMTFTLTFPDGLIAHCSTSYATGTNAFTAYSERGSFGRRSRVPGEQGLRDVRIMMAAYESARTGTAVQLDVR